MLLEDIIIVIFKKKIQDPTHFLKIVKKTQNWWISEKFDLRPTLVDTPREKEKNSP
jgi:hypothetical protein